MQTKQQWQPAGRLPVAVRCSPRRCPRSNLVGYPPAATAEMHPEYRIGTASWTDPTLLAAGYYPRTAKTAEARLRFYADHFNTVEVDSTYYALPAERNALLWAQRTPSGFQFNIKAFALLTQHAAETRALPAALKALLPRDALRQARLSHPPEPVLELSFEMFRAALAPLRSAGKLGCILFQFPPWFVANAQHAAYIDFCRTRLPDDRLAIEFRHTSWLNGRTTETLEFLARPQPDVGLRRCAPARPALRGRRSWRRQTSPTCVCTDATGSRGSSAAARPRSASTTSYSEAEIADCADAIRGLRSSAPGGPQPRVAHVIFNNCYADYGVRNARTMQGLLERSR